MIDILRPDTDSQFRLRLCRKCGGENAGYMGKHGAIRVVCPDCGQRTGVYECAHDAQMVWNGTGKVHRKRK